MWKILIRILDCGNQQSYRIRGDIWKDVQKVLLTGFIAPGPTELFIRAGRIPQQWKTSSVVLILESSTNTDDPHNYRPISSLLSASYWRDIIMHSLVSHATLSWEKFDLWCSEESTITVKHGYCQPFMTSFSFWSIAQMSASLFWLEESFWQCIYLTSHLNVCVFGNILDRPHRT